MAKKTDINQKARSDNAKNNPPPLHGRDALFSSARTGTVGTKRQTYHIHVDLIAKLRGYAYWEQQRISEVVNYALEQFFEDKEIKARPLQKRLIKEKNEKRDYDYYGQLEK